jgi:hypothetical protein
MKWLYYKGEDPNAQGTVFWCVWDTMGAEFQVSTRGEAHSLCYFLNKNAVNGKFEDLDELYELWSNR